MQAERSIDAGASILDRIVETKRAEIAAISARAGEFRSRAADAPPPREFARALTMAGEVRLLAEIKRRSPSAGPIRPGLDVAEAAREYEAGGAAALSVLTDATYFGGGLDALSTASLAVGLPVLRKDFILDPVQVWEARAEGADAVLLIARILGDSRLSELLETTSATGMDALIEVHDAEELDRVLSVGARLIGINNRDLSSFRTNTSISEMLAPRVSAGVTVVAESGIHSPEDVRRLGAAGVDAVLVGESLMRQVDLRAATAALVGQPKRSRVPEGANG